MLNQFNKIKDHYQYLTPIIIEVGSKCVSRWVDPYTNEIDWCSIFSPIEMQTWMSLRCFGKCPLYPQYPVGKYYTDFGNPYVKVAIECDGKEWHQDKEKDKKRDIYFKNLGWDVFRISGNDCFRIIDESDLDYMDERENIRILKDVFCKTIEGLIKSIAIFYFGDRSHNRFCNKYELAFDCVSNRISIGDKKLNNVYENIMSDYLNNMPLEIRNKTLWL